MVCFCLIFVAVVIILDDISPLYLPFSPFLSLSLPPSVLSPSPPLSLALSFPLSLGLGTKHGNSFSLIKAENEGIFAIDRSGGASGGVFAKINGEMWSLAVSYSSSTSHSDSFVL